ncbi:MAG: 4'-phosphopantetheinyl transferase superfamily protein [Gammaproteobacteria bacterium]|nr:4'-phosphopantetheinyl transferase superfamily protein [Gammaproteobacteria bacterium]
MQEQLALEPNTIHLWSCFCNEITDTSLLANYIALLEEEEKTKHQRFYFEKSRHQYLITRALVRSVLSLYANIEPDQWRFIKNAYGRPEISPLLPRQKPYSNLRFNLSHADGLIICGVTTNHEIGVDVENLTRTNDVLGIADRYFSSTEVTELFSQPNTHQRARFFDYWTLKESYIKAKGMGLSLPLDQFSFHVPQNTPITISFDPRLKDNPDHWRFWRYRPSNEHQIALAVESSSSSREMMSVQSYQIVPLQNWSKFSIIEL